jgi:hypothetical protein
LSERILVADLRSGLFIAKVEILIEYAFEEKKRGFGWLVLCQINGASPLRGCWFGMDKSLDQG